MKKINPPNLPKRNHTVVVPNFFGEGKNLEAWQLGWQPENRMEARSSVSKKIFNNYIDDMGMNMVFYYVDDNHWYGIHNEIRPFPFFRFIPKEGMVFPHDQMPGDIHNYEKNDILQWIDCESSAWNEIKVNDKSLEKVLQRSYILVS